MTDFPFVFAYLGVCSILYVISKWLNLSYRSYPEEKQDCPPASLYWLFSGIFRILSFPLSYVFRYLDREGEELARKDSLRVSASHWVPQLKELEDKPWSQEGSREIKSLLFAQSVWYEISDFCKSNHYSESLDLKVHFYACLQYLLKDTLCHYAFGNALNDNFKPLIYHYTDLTFRDTDQIDRLVILHNKFYGILREYSPPQGRDYQSVLSSTIMWGVPDDEYDADIYNSSCETAAEDFSNRVDKLKAYANALFSNSILTKK